MYFMSTACGRPQEGGGPAHVDRGEGGQKSDFLDVINGWPLSWAACLYKYTSSSGVGSLSARDQ